MKKVIAGLAVAGAATLSIFGFAGHASAQQACVTVHIHIGAPTPPVGLPVALPVGVPEGVDQTACVPPDGGVPALPPLPPLPPLPLPV